MPITSSAKKALRASDRKRVYNARRKKDVSVSIKSLKKLVASGDKKKAVEEMSKVQKALDKAVKGNTLKKNAASRKKSRLSKLIKKL
jgi:small subunit ribosomal protein S20